nr:MAG TPA: Terminase small subunit [Caudoviricetes sp.]
MAKLTAKQQRFVDEYLIDLNATQAAIRAGYSPQTAQEQGSQNLSKLMVSEAIDKALAARSRRTGITQDRVLRELAKVAFVNANDVIDPDSATVRADATEDDLACIQAVKVKTSESEMGSSSEREIKLYDKMRALEMLGKHLGLFDKRGQDSSNGEKNNLLEAIAATEEIDTDDLPEVE